MTMLDFIISIASSIIGGVLLIVIAGKLSKNAKWILVSILSKITDADIEYVFENKSVMKEDILKDIEQSSFFFMLTGRGNELQRDTFETLYKPRRKGHNIKIKILVPEVEKEINDVDWTDLRDKEIGEFDAAHGNGLLKDQIKTTIKFLSKHIASNQIDLEVKKFDMPHYGRLIVTDKHAYFSPLGFKNHNRTNSVYKYGSKGQMYEGYLRFFNILWAESKSIS